MPAHLKIQEDNSHRIRISIISIVLGVLILSLKMAAYLVTNSSALKSDALESVVNVVSAVFALGAVIFAERPADENHPYGHGKIEHFSAAFEGGLISLAAILILYEGVMAFIHKPVLIAINNGLLLNLLAGALNGLLGSWLIRSGKKWHSKALEADGHHLMSDFYTSIGLLAGLLVVKFTKLYWLDAAITIMIGLFLCKTGFYLVKSSSDALLDKEDPSLIKKLVESMNKIKTSSVIGVHALRTLRTGRYTHIDIHVAVPEFAAIADVHDEVDRFGQLVLKDLNLEGEFHAHLDPCRQLYCQHCSINHCPIRKNAFASAADFTIQQAVSTAP